MSDPDTNASTRKRQQPWALFRNAFSNKGWSRGSPWASTGMRKGEARVLLTLLRLKFGTVSEGVEARIDQADADTLLRWSGRVLSAGDIEVVVGDDR